MALTESEAERYDRQIRVWGAEAQSRIQNSKVLICGMSKMNVEVTKNIVLAGINVTIQSSRDVHFADLSHNFFLSTEDVGKQVAQAVLPRVKDLNSFALVDAVCEDIDSLPDQFFAKFNVVLLTECSEVQAFRINSICRQRSPSAQFFWSDVFGEEGIFYADFGPSFEFKPDKKLTSNPTAAATSTTANGSNASSSGSSSSSSSSSADAGSSSSSGNANAASAIKVMQFPALGEVLAKKWKEIPSRFFPLSKTFVKHRILTKFRDTYGHSPKLGDSDGALLNSLLAKLQAENDMTVVSSNNGSSVEPVLSAEELKTLSQISDSASVLACSVLGSFLAQEVIKAVSMTGEPAFNVFVFSGDDYSAKAFPINP